MCPRKPTHRVLLGETCRTASKTLAMTSLLYSGYDSICDLTPVSCVYQTCTPQAFKEIDTCGFCGVAGVGACNTWVHVHPKGKKDAQRALQLHFRSKGDERNAPVTLSLKTASKKLSSIQRALTSPLSAFFAKSTVGYGGTLYGPPRADGTRRGR